MLSRVLFLVLLPGILVAQSQLDIDKHISRIIAQGDETTNQRYFDLLIYYYDNPLNINEVTKDEILQLGLLEESQVEAILKHRQQTGAYRSIYELQAVEGMSVDEIRRLRPFIVVPVGNKLSNSFRGLGRGKNNYMMASYSRLLETVRGIEEGIYLGSPDKTQMRLRLRNPGKLSIGLAAQKDPGEPWLHNTKIKSPDYLTGHLYLEEHGHLKQLALGDYRLQFGQGLILGAGFMAGKNTEAVTSVKQTTVGILPYSSVTEANFFRGIATQVRIFENLDVTLFYSNQRLDATPHSDDPQAVTGIRIGGLHRTASELRAMDQLHEQVWGTAIHYRQGHFATGGLIVSSQFDKFIRPAERVYNQFRFSGRQLTNFSWFGEYQFNNFNWFGELAKSAGGGWGINSGVLGQISQHAGMSFSIRYLESDFHSLYGQSFTERSTLGNENGLYWGLKLHPLKRLTITSYYDIYKFPWLTAATAAPSHGTDIMARVEYHFSKFNKAFIQLRSEKAETAITNNPADQITNNTIIKSIINFDYASSSSLNFRSRLQLNRFNDQEDGLLLLQDINYSTMKFGISGRVLFFDTESFNTRQYVYEKDMLFAYNTRAFFGRGLNYYILVKYKPTRPLTIRAKCSLTEYLGVNAIGSGYNLIQGKTRTQITAQLHYKF